MGGVASLEIERQLHDYRYRHNRDLFGASETTWVKLWISWRTLQPEPARDREHAWQHLSKLPALSNLDAQIAAANADSVRVILALDEFAPAWAADDPEEGRARPPADRSPAGPWSWFIEHLCARYRIAAGNSAGAFVDAIEILNEPNLRWPQAGAAAATAEMVRTAAQLCADHGRVPLLVPSLSDLRDDQLTGPWGAGTPLREFAAELLAHLGNSVPAGSIGWSQHNYGDIAAGDADGVRAALEVLEAPGASAWDGGVRLTEGAYLTDDPRTMTLADAVDCELEQAELLRKNFNASAALPQVALWTHHSVHDLPINRVKHGLYADFDWKRGIPGAEKLAWDVFAGLTDLGARSPHAAGESVPQPARSAAAA